jgi:hypothetical protein
MRRPALVLVVVALAAVAVAGGAWLSRRGDGNAPPRGVASRWFSDPLPSDADRTVLLTTAASAEPCGDGCPFDRIVAGAEGRDGIAAVLAAVGEGVDNLATLDEASADAKRAIVRTHRALDVRLRQGDAGPPLRALVVARGAASRATGAPALRAVLVFDHAHPRLDRGRPPGGRSGVRLLVSRRASPSGGVAGVVEVAEPTPEGRESLLDLPPYARALREPAPSVVAAPVDGGYRRLGLALRDDGRVTGYGAKRASPETPAPTLEAALARLLSGL